MDAKERDLESMEKQVKTMIDEGKNIRWGDFIVNKREPENGNNGLYIWNGEKILKLVDDRCCGERVPDEFKVDADYHPTYWYDSFKLCKKKNRRFVYHGKHVNYDHIPLRDAFIKNLKQKHEHCVTFARNGKGKQKMYIIFCDMSVEDAKKLLEKDKMDFKCTPSQYRVEYTGHNVLYI